MSEKITVALSPAELETMKALLNMAIAGIREEIGVAQRKPESKRNAAPLEYLCQLDEDLSNALSALLAAKHGHEKHTFLSFEDLL